MIDQFCAHGKSMKYNCLDCIAEAVNYDPSTGKQWANIGPELVEALEEAIEELDEWCVEADGEGFNKPSFNELIAKAKAIDTKPTSGD